jgi:hypothetical protein
MNILLERRKKFKNIKKKKVFIEKKKIKKELNVFFINNVK